MAVDVKQYIEQLAQTAGLSEEEKAGILKVASSNDKFSTALGADIMRQQDYSRNMDAVAADKRKTANYYQELLTWKAGEDARLAELAGNGNNNGNGEYLTKKEMDEREKKFNDTLKQQEQSFITIAKVMGRLSSQHAVEFKEALDVDALEKIAVEKQLPLTQAYETLVASRRAETSATTRLAEIEKAKADAVREYASTHHIPLDTSQRESPYGRPSFDKAQSAVPDYTPNSGQLSTTGSRTLRDNFVAEWDKAGAAPQGT